MTFEPRFELHLMWHHGERAAVDFAEKSRNWNLSVFYWEIPKLVSSPTQLTIYQEVEGRSRDDDEQRTKERVIFYFNERRRKISSSSRFQSPLQSFYLHFQQTPRVPPSTRFCANSKSLTFLSRLLKLAWEWSEKNSFLCCSAASVLGFMSNA